MKNEKLNGIDVYVSEIPEDVIIESVYPPIRDKEIAEIKNDKVRAEKFRVWKVLLYAIKNSLGVDPETVKFKKTSSGKWQADGFYFSLTHSGNKVAVAVSPFEVGVDMEQKNLFFSKITAEKEERFAGKITADSEELPKTFEELIILWTKKESAYKFLGKGGFNPKKIDTEKFVFKVFNTEEYVLTVCGENADKAQIKEIMYF